MAWRWCAIQHCNEICLWLYFQGQFDVIFGFTIYFHIYINEERHHSDLIFYGDVADNAGLAISIDGTALVISASNRDNSISKEATFEGLTTGAWQKVLIHFTPEDKFSVSFDGGAAVDVATDLKDVNTKSQVVVISDGFDGLLSCLQIFNRVVLAADIDETKCTSGKSHHWFC